MSAQAGADFAVARANRGIGVGDFDSDGRLDLVVSVLGERPQLLHNVSDTANAWIALRLVGQASNREGLGARVQLGSQWNHMTTAVGYASSSDYGVHFGAGQREDHRADRDPLAERCDPDARERGRRTRC